MKILLVIFSLGLAGCATSGNLISTDEVQIVKFGKIRYDWYQEIGETNGHFFYVKKTPRTVTNYLTGDWEEITMTQHDDEVKK